MRSGRGFVSRGGARCTDATSLVNELEQPRRVVHAHLMREAIMGHPWSSVAIMGHLPNKVDTYPCHQGHSHAIKGTQARSHLPEPDHVDGAVAVLTHLMRDAISGHQWFISGHQWSSVKISRRPHAPRSASSRRADRAPGRDRPRRSSRPPDAIRGDQR